MRQLHEFSEAFMDRVKLLYASMVKISTSNVLMNISIEYIIINDITEYAMMESFTTQMGFTSEKFLLILRKTNKNIF